MVGEKEQATGCVDIRGRDGQMLGSKRVDETAEFFKSMLPQRSKCYEELYSKAWRAVDYPASEYKEEEKKSE